MINTINKDAVRRKWHKFRHATYEKKEYLMTEREGIGLLCKYEYEYIRERWRTN